jgi:nitrogen fixation protein FixH
LPFFVKGTDTSGTVSLRRDNAAAAAKKARELIDDGSWDVEITAPDGLAYPFAEFEATQMTGAAHSSA